MLDLEKEAIMESWNGLGGIISFHPSCPGQGHLPPLCVIGEEHSKAWKGGLGRINVGK